MKLHDVAMRAIAKKIMWWPAVEIGQRATDLSVIRTK
jgi:hypothetical protein